MFPAPDWTSRGKTKALEQEGIRCVYGWTETLTDTLLCLPTDPQKLPGHSIEEWEVFVWNRPCGVRAQFASLLGLPVYKPDDHPNGSDSL